MKYSGASALPAERRHPRDMVNSKLQTYLTDFLRARFAGKSAKSGSFHGVEIFEAHAIYHRAINPDAAERSRRRETGQGLSGGNAADKDC